MWKLLLFATVSCALLTMLVVTRTALMMKMPVGLLVKKLFPSFLLCFSSSSSAAGLGTSIENGEKLLGIDKRLLKVAMPIGNVVYMGAIPVECVGICFYLAGLYGISVNLTWIVVAVFLAVVLTVAVPPMPGAGLMLVAALFTQLELPAEGMVIAIAFDIVYDFIASGFDNTFLLAELVAQADKGGMLDGEVLRSAKG